MKHCPNCHATLEDEAAFCVYCGTKIDTIVPAGPTCPNCHAPIEDGATFCVYCGTKIEEKEEEKAAAQKSLHDYANSMNAEYEKEKKERNQVLLFGLIIILVVALIGGATYYLMQENTSDEEIVASEEIITEPEIVTIEEEDNEDDIEEIKKDVLAALSNTIIIDGNYLLLTFKDDYEATQIAGEYDDPEELETYTFNKGDVICNSTQLGYFVEKMGNDGYNVSRIQDNDYYVPKNVVHVREEMVGCIDLNILDKATLHFKTDDNRSCTLYKLNKNGYKVRRDNGTTINGNVYCLESDNRFIALLTNEQHGMDGNEFYRNENKDVDKSHTLKKDIQCGSGNSRYSSLYYVPSKRCLLWDDRQYKLTEVEPNI